jgi:translation initiation factor IF-3
MDYGKFKYEAAQKARESRKNQVLTVIKEMKLRPKIDPHDYETKKGHVVRFLKAGDKVKITIMFRGREQSRPELGFRLLQRLGEDVQELGFVESSPKQDGRNMIMVLAPHKNAADLKKIAADQKAAEGGRAGQEAGQSAGQAPDAEPIEPIEPIEPADLTEPVAQLDDATQTEDAVQEDAVQDSTDGTPSVEN